MGQKMGHRQFSREFKRNALQLVMEKGISVGKVARDLDIHPNLIHRDGEMIGVVVVAVPTLGGVGDDRAETGCGSIHHLDRGRQYASYGYQALLKRYDITPSMSRKEECIK